MVAATAGALVGAYLLTQPAAALQRVGVTTPGSWATAEARGFGGGLLAAHALTAATLMQAPRFGACFAAALAALWWGAAFGKLISLLRDRPRSRAAAVTLALDSAMALALAAPLWAYLRILRAHAGF